METKIEKLKRNWLFKRPDQFNSSWQMICWWEKRRIPYNLLVGATGIITCLGLAVLAGLVTIIKNDENVGSPFLIVFAIIGYGIGANVCYTAGWITELIANRGWGDRARAYGEIVFFFGIFFSIGLTLVPLVVGGALLEISKWLK